MKQRLLELLEGSGVRAPTHREIEVTPFSPHPSLSAALGTEIFLKREDRLDDLGCGHKLRKLSYVVADALGKSSTVLITVGSVPSNQCKAVALAARQRGLRAHVVYLGDHQVRPMQAHGNYWLTSLLEPDVSWFERAPWSRAEKHLQDIFAAEQARGERPYLIGSGVSDWPGILGSFELGLEMGEQAIDRGLHSLDVVAPAGSGGTCVGIAIAAAYLHLDWKIHGICIGESADVLSKRAQSFVKGVAEKLPALRGQCAAMRFYDVALGVGYDTPTADELRVMQDTLQRHQLLLDPNYMLKCFIGLQRLLEGGVIMQGNPVALVHTGGQVGLYDAHPKVTQWHRHSAAAWLSDLPPELSNAGA